MSLSRLKINHISNEICADCSATEATWASLNLGVILCTECSSVHRSLGRHISQVKSLRHGNFHPNQLAMVYTLYQSGANNIWEHSLLDPQQSSKYKRKPNPRDAVYPTKAEFIRAKYQLQSFILHRRSADASTASVEDLSRQLTSCVRTTHLEVTLRLLTLGANPDWLGPGGTRALHVAAREGQSLQVELLCICGADPAAPDLKGRTPEDVALESGYPDLALRLTELQYEVTDRLSNFLCGRKPDHRSSQHWLIPEMAATSSLYSSEANLGAAADSSRFVVRRRLATLATPALEKLIQDVYDEVDRREVDAAWIASHSKNAPVNERYIVPFLPVNPNLSAVRNQSRQKLAKYGSREFASLVVDVLSEVRVRQLGPDAVIAANELHSSHSADLAMATIPINSQQQREFGSSSPRKSEQHHSASAVLVNGCLEMTPPPYSSAPEKINRSDIRRDTSSPASYDEVASDRLSDMSDSFLALLAPQKQVIEAEMTNNVNIASDEEDEQHQEQIVANRVIKQKVTRTSAPRVTQHPYEPRTAMTAVRSASAALPATSVIDFAELRDIRQEARANQTRIEHVIQSHQEILSRISQLERKVQVLEEENERLKQMESKFMTTVASSSPTILDSDSQIRITTTSTFPAPKRSLSPVKERSLSPVKEMKETVKKSSSVPVKPVTRIVESDGASSNDEPSYWAPVTVSLVEELTVVIQTLLKASKEGKASYELTPIVAKARKLATNLATLSPDEHISQTLRQSATSLAMSVVSKHKSVADRNETIVEQAFQLANAAKQLIIIVRNMPSA